MDSLIRLRQMRQSELSGYFALLFPSLLTEYGSTAYYLNTNPSGYQTAENLTGYLAKNETGQFYSISNPSGYITADDIDYSSYLPLSQTGLFYPRTNPSGYFAMGDKYLRLGNEYIADAINFDNISNFYMGNSDISEGVIDFYGNYLGSYGQSYLEGFSISATRYLRLSGINVVLENQTGSFATTGFVNTFSTGKFIQLRDPNYQGENLTNVLMYWNSSGYLEHSLVPGEGTFIVRHNEWNPIELSVSEPCYFHTPNVGKYIYLDGAEIVNFTLTDCSLNNTGEFVTNSQTGQFVNLSSNQTISGEKTFVSTVRASNINSTGSFSNLTLDAYNVVLNGRGIELNTTDQPFTINIGGDSAFSLLSSSNVNVITTDETYGDIKLTSAKNLEFNVTGLSLLNGYNIVTSQMTGEFVTSSQTGVFITSGQTGLFYPRNNPSGFVTSGQTGNFVTINQTGNFVTTNQTGNFITSSQTGTFVTSSQTGNFITSSQTGVFVTSGQTGQFYPASNPSGYINTASYNSLDRKVYSFFLNPTESFIYTNNGAYLNKSDPSVGGGTAIKKAYNADTSPYISNSHNIALIPTGVTGYVVNLDFFTTGITTSANYFVWFLHGLDENASQWYDIKALYYNPSLTGAGTGNKIQRVYYTGAFSPTGKISLNSRIAFQQTYPLDIYYLGGRCDFF